MARCMWDYGENVGDDMSHIKTMPSKKSCQIISLQATWLKMKSFNWDDFVFSFAA